MLLDYACILTGYMKALPAASEGISTLMGNAYRGIRPETIPEGVFPENGYGIVVLERGDKGILSSRDTWDTDSTAASGNACGIVSWTRRICCCLSLLTML